MFLDSCDALQNGIHIKDLSGARPWIRYSVGRNRDGSRLRRVRIADIQDAFFWSQDGRNTWLLLYVSFLPMNQAKKIGLVSAKVFMCKIPVLGFPDVRPEDTLLEVRDLVETIHVELANEGSKVLVFEPPGKYFAREAFMIKDY